MRTRQASFFPKKSASYGGILRKTRAGRLGARALSTRHSMHLVLRSSKAKGLWSFIRFRAPISQIVRKHAARNAIQILSLANVGNHLHLHIRLHSHRSYFPFIRAITGGIVLAVTGANKFKNLTVIGGGMGVKTHKDRFWDYRPFSKIVSSFRHFMNMKDYMTINQLEGYGSSRLSARLFIAWKKDGVAIDYEDDA